MDPAYDVLEAHSKDNPFCRLILEFMVRNPIDNYAKIRFCSMESLLGELRVFATNLTQLTKLLQKMERDESPQFEVEQVVAVFMIHLSSVFCRNVVEILIRLSFEVEPHIAFWEQQCRLNDDRNSNWMAKLRRFSPLSISMQKARIFKKLSSDLHAQMGNMQCWFWEMVRLKLGHNEDHRQCMKRVSEFIAEMKDRYKIDHQRHSDEHRDANMMDAMLEIICCADSWTIKVEKEIYRLGKPSILQQHYKLYSFYSLSLLICGSIAYYKWDTVQWLGGSLGVIGYNLMAEHLYQPIKSIVEDVIDFNALQKEENALSYEMEKAALSQMITSFERKHLGVSQSDSIADGQRGDMTLIMQQYQKDIAVDNAIGSVTKGSLLTNLFVQIQKMKVELSKLMIINSVNMEMMATVPLMGTLYLLHQVYSTRRGTKHLERERRRDLRFLFRSIFSVLSKVDDLSLGVNDRSQHLEHEEQGLVLFLIYKCFVWEQKQTKTPLTKEERIWFCYDLNHLISRQFTAKQSVSLLNRMETYYLR